MKRWLNLIIIALLMGSVTGASAQGTAPSVAFINNSGQLVVASADGLARWIVTNPGETLVKPVGFTWSPDRTRLFFAVDSGGVVSLRVGQVASQNISEIGQASGALSGGDWTADGRNVLIGSNSSAMLFSTDGSGGSTLFSLASALNLASPFANERPNLPPAHSLSPEGGYVFFWQSDSSQGNYGIYAINSGSAFVIPVQNDANARQSGLWSEASPLVAFWGFSGGTSVLAVTHAANGQTLILSSGRTAPIEPLAWRPGTDQLLYRDASNSVRIADMGCLNNGCGTNPLETGAELLPATASDIQVVARSDWLYFRDGEQVKAVNLACTASGNCLNSAVTLANSAAQRTWLHVAGNLLAYTAYAQDPNNPNDREARVLDVACVNDPSSCRPVAISGQAVGGLVSPDGAYLTIDQASSGLNAVYIPSLQFTYMSGSFGGQLGTGLNFARWQ